MKKLWFCLVIILSLSNTCNEEKTFNTKTRPNYNPSENTVHVKDKMKGLSFVAPPDPFATNPMSAINDLGANWIAVIPYAFTRLGEAFVSYNQGGYQWWGERPEGAHESIRLAKEANLCVMLKPQVYIPRGWTGDLDFEQEADWAKWEKDYEAYILPFADMADSMKVELFCIGTEFKIGVQKRSDFWSQLIKKVRARYSGKLVYASNWDEFPLVPFWDELDYIGINAYFPIVNEATPTIETLRKGWESHLDKIRQFQLKYQKPIIFTEYGYLSVDGASYNTWELEGKLREVNVNEPAQANAVEALFQTFWEEPYWAGGFIWKWYPQQGRRSRDKDYTPQGKQAQATLEKWFKSKKDTQ